MYQQVIYFALFENTAGNYVNYHFYLSCSINKIYDTLVFFKYFLFVHTNNYNYPMHGEYPSDA